MYVHQPGLLLALVGASLAVRSVIAAGQNKAHVHTEAAAMDKERLHWEVLEQLNLVSERGRKAVVASMVAEMVAATAALGMVRIRHTVADNTAPIVEEDLVLYYPLENAIVHRRKDS